MLHAILAYPVKLAVALTSPIVDPDDKPHGAWNKHLTVVAVLLLPAFSTLAFDGERQKYLSINQSVAIPVTRCEEN